MSSTKIHIPDRKKAPPFKDAIEFSLALPPYQKNILSNGVEVYAIDLGNLDTLMVNWVFDAGNWYEEKNGVAAAVSSLIKNGTSGRNAFAINEHFEYYGSYLSRASHHETADITLHCLGKHIAELLPVVAELVMDSVYTQEELDIYKKNSQQRLQVNLKKCDFVAGRLIDAYLYGESHPYGKYSTLADYQALERQDLTGFYKKYYQQGHCRIFVAGKLPPGIMDRLEQHFGHLPLRAPVNLGVSSATPGSSVDGSDGSHSVTAEGGTPSIPLSPAREKKYHIINDPHGVQGSIRIARNMPNRHHPDFLKVQVLNNVFGGFFGSRLMTNIREDKGYTYGIYSYLSGNRQASAWIVSTEAGKEVCAATIAEVYKEMQGLREELIGEEELQIVRNFAIGTVLGDLDGPFHVASRWKNIILNGLTGEYFTQGIETVKTITPHALRELARKYLDPADFFELLVI